MTTRFIGLKVVANMLVIAGWLLLFVGVYLISVSGSALNGAPHSEIAQTVVFFIWAPAIVLGLLLVGAGEFFKVVMAIEINTRHNEPTPQEKSTTSLKWLRAAAAEPTSGLQMTGREVGQPETILEYTSVGERAL